MITTIEIDDVVFKKLDKVVNTNVEDREKTYNWLFDQLRGSYRVLPYRNKSMYDLKIPFDSIYNQTKNHLIFSDIDGWHRDNDFNIIIEHTFEAHKSSWGQKQWYKKVWKYIDGVKDSSKPTYVICTTNSHNYNNDQDRGKEVFDIDHVLVQYIFKCQNGDYELVDFDRENGCGIVKILDQITDFYYTK